ncbi:protein early responsive to dehydration 15 [Phtheirospermum japonicum]|uniref:Protein early responsive to dehydration 15 n=1 Tax=Phtheirospermum japonicum TaxID=374723 RepID=A0A830BE05_9LAMI|nr:protein early responsive to dehydration 15 [Phtheirospermum japonicum]
MFLVCLDETMSLTYLPLRTTLPINPGLTCMKYVNGNHFIKLFNICSRPFNILGLDIEPPSFSLGLDFETQSSSVPDPLLQPVKRPSPAASFWTIERDDDDFESPVRVSYPPRSFKRLRRRSTPRFVPDPRKVEPVANEEIEESSSDEDWPRGDALLLEVFDVMKNVQGLATIPVSSLTDNSVSDFNLNNTLNHGSSIWRKIIAQSKCTAVRSSGAEASGELLAGVAIKVTIHQVKQSHRNSTGNVLTDNCRGFGMNPDALVKYLNVQRGLKSPGLLRFCKVFSEEVYGLTASFDYNLSHKTRIGAGSL